MASGCGAADAPEGSFAEDLAFGGGRAPAEDVVEPLEDPAGGSGEVELAVSGSYAPAVEDAARRRLNDHRVAHAGAARLPVYDCLKAHARRHARRMAAEGRIFYTGDLATAVDRSCDRFWGALSENVAAGSTEVGIFTKLLADSTDHANIDQALWNGVGIGAFRAGSGRLYLTQVFVRWRPEPKALLVDASGPGDAR